MNNGIDLTPLVAQAKRMIANSGFVLSSEDWRGFTATDMGLGNFASEGFMFTDVLRTNRVRITCLVLLPGQTLPEHLHPDIDGNSGKEETIRVLSGETMVYVPGEENNPDMIIPPGKDPFYTVRHEIRLQTGGQYTVTPGAVHWFQGGPDGSVNLTFQNRVDETLNVFTDPACTGCPIPLD